MNATTTIDSGAVIRVKTKRIVKAALGFCFCTLLANGAAAQAITISGTVFNDADGGTISGPPIGMVNNQPMYIYLIDSTMRVTAVDTVDATNGTFSITGTAFKNYNVALTTSTAGIGALYPNLGLPNNYVPTAEGTTAIGDGTPDFAVAINSAADITINYAIDARPEGYSFVLSNPTRDSLNRIEIPSDAFRGEDLEDGNYITGLTGRKVDLYQATGGSLYYNDTLISFSAASSATRILNFQSSRLRFVPASGTVRSFAYSILDNADVVELVPNSVSIAAPLPVTLTQFYGNRLNTGNRLYWSTATESGSAGFEVQRSTDGQSFRKIAYIASKAENGRSQRTLDYTAMDNSVSELQSGVVFYRLRQIDLNGESMISNTIRMTSGNVLSPELRISAYPNPSTTMLSLDLSSGTDAASEFVVTISSLTGQTIGQHRFQTMNGRVSTALDVSTIPAGQYFVRLDVAGAAYRSIPVAIVR